MTALTGKVAIVTGGNSGIGKAIVLALAEAGANIVIDYVANEQATEDLEKKVAALGDQSIGIDADVSKVEDLERLERAETGGSTVEREMGRWIERVEETQGAWSRVKGSSTEALREVREEKHARRNGVPRREPRAQAARRRGR